MRRVLVATVAAVLVGVVVGVMVAWTPRSGPAVPPVERVLIVSVPALTWGDVAGTSMPNLSRLVDRAAVGNLATRSLSREGSLDDGYVILGAGARAVGPGDGSGGEAFEVGEAFAGDATGEVYAQRTREDAGGGLVHLGVESIREANAAPRFDAQVGALGDVLERAGWSRSVIANADGLDAAGGGHYGRQAVAALMGSDGRVPEGRVGAELLVDDPGAPSGFRYDNVVVTAAFRDTWRPRSVVLVEASDLVRADRARQLAPPGERAQLWRDALRATDELVGTLLSDVDPTRDAVFVVGATHPRSAARLTVAALAAPGIEVGLLRSATTQRSGFVSLVDVAPTVLERLGLGRPDAMEGRPIRVGEQAGSGADRRSWLADADTAARFREHHTPPVVLVFVGMQALLVVGLHSWLLRPQRAALGTLLRFGALATLGYVPAVYLARLAPFHDTNGWWYWVFLVTAGAALAALYQLAGRHTPLDPLMVALGVVVAILVVDVVVGARLQFLSPLGYAPKLAGRFRGLGNVGYAMLASATVLLAALLAHRNKGTRGVQLAVATMAGVVVIVGAPWWGANVGGVLSAFPAFAVITWVLFGRVIRPRVVALLAPLTLGAVILFGVVDLARPAGDRTHLGRLLERIATQGWPGFEAVVLRKLEENLSTMTRSPWLAMVPVVVGCLAYLCLRWRARLLGLFEWIPELRVALMGFSVLAVLGFSLNDTGIAVLGAMLGVLNAALVFLMVTQPTSGSSASAAQRVDSRPLLIAGSSMWPGADRE